MFKWSCSAVMAYCDADVSSAEGFLLIKRCWR